MYTKYMNTALAPLIGTKRNLIESMLVGVFMFAVTMIYEMVSAYFVPEYSLNMFEFVGTWSGLVCVWLSRTRNIHCWPWGIVSCISLGFFFAQIALPGQQWLNWAYFTAVQLWSWPHWAFGGDNFDELPVTTMRWLERAFYIAVIAGGTAIIFTLIGYFSPGSFHPILDSLVVASSIVAQFLLGRKKVESWILWLGPVNMLSIYLFFAAGAYTLTALYVAFFIHACFAVRSWQKAAVRQKEGELQYV